MQAYTFIPIAVETMAAINNDSIDFLDDLGLGALHVLLMISERAP